MSQPPLKFVPIYKARPWGGTRIAERFSRLIPKDALPCGESWEIVDRPEDQSVVENGPYQGTTLGELWQKHRQDLFGCNATHGERFPLLVKLLNVEEPLSVQVHPSEESARETGGEPKPELWYFLETRPDTRVWLGLRKDCTKATFREAIQLGTVAECLHQLQPQPHQTAFIGGGRVHALGGGALLMEIQQNSDTTFRVHDWDRLGLDGNPRDLHIEKSLATINFKDHAPGFLPADKSPLVENVPFTVDCLNLACDQSHDTETTHHFALFGVVAGSLVCGGHPFREGDVFIQPVGNNQLLAGPQGCRLLRATI